MPRSLRCYKSGSNTIERRSKMWHQVAARSVMAGLVGCIGLEAACAGNPESPDSLSFTAPVPGVTAVRPNIGSTGGGSSIQLFGNGMRLGLTVTFGDVKVTSRTDTTAGIFLETPAHVAGPVDLVVTNPDGRSQRLAAAYTYVSPESFDLSGAWTGVAFDGSDRMMAFSIENNRLVGASCSYDSTVALPLPSPPPSVSNGEFSVVGRDGVIFSGRIVSPFEVIGTMNFSECTNMQWKTYPRS
jgi:hypothetical protein